MSNMYGMRRANGDWFAMDKGGRLHVPVFHSSWEAMLARVRNWGMQLFKPVLLGERALKDLATADGGSAARFWLVESPSADLKRGRVLEHAQLSGFIDSSTERPHEPAGTLGLR
jgi:hypothetical protein